ncbi:pentapeptide repeat-containing protein [Cryptosporangium sp. NPDC048952]|uniref:pentapeptide repeat-containing protein n=1 Tax=Cryptosporangium sp. NPDC048952 TaxID=3363961 RepID=UPI0037147CF0
MAARWRWLVAAVAVLVGAALFVLLPEWLLRHDLGAAAAAKLPPTDRAQALSQTRGQLLQAFGAVAVLSGAVLAWSQLRQSAAATTAQLVVQRQGQVTDRYTKAIELLASTDRTLRVGGILALDRIAGESPPDRVTIVNVLGSYLRSEAPWPPADDAAPIAADLPLRVRQQDAQAALSVVGRRISADDQPVDWITVDLSGTDLRNGNFAKGSFWHARFTDANLSGANLRGADLRGADFTRTTLTGVDLAGAWWDDTTWWPEGFTLRPEPP